MRNLYLAEKRLLEVMSEAAWGITVESPASVVAELLEPKQRLDSSVVLAQDFAVEFVKRPLPSGEFVTACEPALPGVFGAEIFLAAEKESMQPLILESMNAYLLGDDVLLPWLRKVDRSVRTACRSSVPAENRASMQGWPQVFGRDEHECNGLAIPCEYVRLVVVRGNICFLLHSHKWLESPSSAVARLTVSGEIDVRCHMSDSECVALDGWVKTLDDSSDIKRIVV